MIIKTINVSDIHLLHHLTTTESIIANLDREFNSKTLLDIDILFIHGDITDRVTNLPDNRVILYRSWIYRLITACKVNHVILRILRGTPSHDFGQGKEFIDVNELSGLNWDVKYFDELDIEYIERFGLNVLYVPDEWRGDTKQTQKEIVELMSSKGLSKVDIVSLHGFFGFQCPQTSQVHDEDFFKSITRYFVCAGHSHLYAESDNIFIQGSFDRIRHGEEEKKGFLKITLDTNNPSLLNREFVENKYATLYITKELTDVVDKDQVKTIIDSVLHTWLEKYEDSLRPPLFFKVKYQEDFDITDILLSYKSHYKYNIKWEFERIVNKEKRKRYDDIVQFIPTPINKDSILSIYKDLLTESDIDQTHGFCLMGIVKDIREKIENERNKK